MDQLKPANPEIPIAEKLAGTEARHCPICGKPATFADRPFCSKRCADVDLHRWLAGVYAISAARESDTEPDRAASRA